MLSKKFSQLKGKVPALEAEEDLLDMEDVVEDEDLFAGEEAAAEELSELQSYPDEVLLKELQKRGFEVPDLEEQVAEDELSEEEDEDLFA